MGEDGILPVSSSSWWPQVFLGLRTHLYNFSVVTCLALCLFCVESPTASLLQRYRCRQLGPHQDEGHVGRDPLPHPVPRRRMGSLGPMLAPPPEAGPGLRPVAIG